MGNPLCHFEFMSSDLQKAKEFYGKVFDWTFDGGGMPGYVMIGTGKSPDGGIMVKPAEAPHCALNAYFEVSSIEETLDKVTSAGGSVVVGKTKIANIGYWAMFADPDGIPVGLFEGLPT